MAKKRKKKRTNPAGGFWPALGGFLAGPLATGLALRGVAAISAPAGIDLVVRPMIANAAGAIAAWHFASQVRDPGWRSFLRGAMWGEIVAAIVGPAYVATAGLPPAPIVEPPEFER